MNPRAERAARLLVSLSTIAGLVGLATTTPRADTITVFGSQTLTRTTGAPNLFDFTFDAGATVSPYLLHIDNHGITSASVTLNGAQIFGPSEFKASVDGLERPVALRATGNRLHVELRSKPGADLDLGGAVSQVYLRISVPASSDDKVGDQFVGARAVDLGRA